MKIWVPGAAGALGREVVAAATVRGHEVLGTTHSQCPIQDMAAILTILKHFDPDCIVNCAGALPAANVIDSALTNTLGPANLAATQVRIVHMSTDCVFSGARSGHWLKSTDWPEPRDVYGRTKLAGEIHADHVLNVRASFLSPHGGFLRWLLDSSGPVDGWERAYWNGTSVGAMADALLTLAEGDATGVLHVAAQDYVSKADLAEFFADRLALPLQVSKVREPEVWRVLEPDYELPEIWSEMEALAACVIRSRS